MTTPFVGEIQLFGFNFAPLDWVQCNGTALPIRQYSTLFSLIGTNYGGDGQVNFYVPNLVNRAACSQGTGPALTPRVIGEVFGDAGVTLTTAQLPQHNHGFSIYNQRTAAKRIATPTAGSTLLPPASAIAFPAAGTASNTTFSPAMLGVSGQSLPHENRQPFLAINYCMALVGTFPTFG